MASTTPTIKRVYSPQYHRGTKEFTYKHRGHDREETRTIPNVGESTLLRRYLEELINKHGDIIDSETVLKYAQDIREAREGKREAPRPDAWFGAYTMSLTEGIPTLDVGEDLGGPSSAGAAADVSMFGFMTPPSGFATPATTSSAITPSSVASALSARGKYARDAQTLRDINKERQARADFVQQPSPLSLLTGKYAPVKVGINPMQTSGAPRMAYINPNHVRAPGSFQVLDTFAVPIPERRGFGYTPMAQRGYYR